MGSTRILWWWMTTNSWQESFLFCRPTSSINLKSLSSNFSNMVTLRWKCYWWSTWSTSSNANTNTCLSKKILRKDHRQVYATKDPKIWLSQNRNNSGQTHEFKSSLSVENVWVELKLGTSQLSSLILSVHQFKWSKTVQPITTQSLSVLTHPYTPRYLSWDRKSWGNPWTWICMMKTYPKRKVKSFLWPCLKIKLLRVRCWNLSLVRLWNSDRWVLEMIIKVSDSALI